jgi:hypothetical protein
MYAFLPSHLQRKTKVLFEKTGQVCLWKKGESNLETTHSEHT